MDTDRRAAAPRRAAQRLLAAASLLACLVGAARPAMACTADTDCKGSRICTAGRCQYPAAPACTADTDCQGALICVAQRCTLPGAPPAAGTLPQAPAALGLVGVITQVDGGTLTLTTQSGPTALPRFQIARVEVALAPGEVFVRGGPILDLLPYRTRAVTLRAGPRTVSGALHAVSNTTLRIETPDGFDDVPVHEIDTLSLSDGATPADGYITVFQRGAPFKTLEAQIGRTVRITRRGEGDLSGTARPTPRARRPGTASPRASTKRKPRRYKRVDAANLVDLAVSYVGVFGDGDAGQHGATLSLAYRRLDPVGRFPDTRGSAVAFDLRVGPVLALEAIPSHQTDRYGETESSTEAIVSLGGKLEIGVSYLIFSTRTVTELTGFGVFAGLGAMYLFPLNGDVDGGFRPSPGLGLEFPTYNRLTGAYSSWRILGALLPGDLTAAQLAIGGSF